MNAFTISLYQPFAIEPLYKYECLLCEYFTECAVRLFAAKQIASGETLSACRILRARPVKLNLICAALSLWPQTKQTALRPPSAQARARQCLC